MLAVRLWSPNEKNGQSELVGTLRWDGKQIVSDMNEAMTKWILGLGVPDPDSDGGLYSGEDPEKWLRNLESQLSNCTGLSAETIE